MTLDLLQFYDGKVLETGGRVSIPTSEGFVATSFQYSYMVFSIDLTAGTELCWFPLEVSGPWAEEGLAVNGQVLTGFLPNVKSNKGIRVPAEADQIELS